MVNWNHVNSIVDIRDKPKLNASGTIEETGGYYGRCEILAALLASKPKDELVHECAGVQIAGGIGPDL